jgi:sister-chromatid-cohesion protein PDS5
VNGVQRDLPDAHRLAVEVCNQASDKLQRYVCQVCYFITRDLFNNPSNPRYMQYFTDVILSSDSQGDGSDREAREEAHDLVRAINRACPSLLANVIPQLEQELDVADHGPRYLATKTLGHMFAERPSIIRTHRTAWEAWLKRMKDISSQVRIALLEGLKGVLARHMEPLQDVQGQSVHCMLATRQLY